MNAAASEEVYLITGSSGFIGSAFFNKIQDTEYKKIYLLDWQPPSPTQVSVIENNPNIVYIQADVRDIAEYETEFDSVTTLVHFAAQPAVPVSTEKPYYDFSVNVDGSMRLLEFARKNKVKHFIFAASGGTIYGETEVIPTPETQMLNPISNYGAAKAAFEMYLRSYASLYDMKTTSLRFGNIFGPGSTHGVMYDFFQKIKSNPDELVILGDGSQTKSYLYIDDCIDGFVKAMNRSNKGFEEFNLSGDESVSVTQIAEFVSKYLNVTPQYKYTGGDRGWKGDVRKGGLTTLKIEKLGWKNVTKFEQAVELYMNWLKKEFDWPHN